MSTVLDPRPEVDGPVVTPRVRTAWRVAASLAAAGLLFWGLSQTVSVLAHEEHELTRTFSADGITTVELDIESGSAEVVAADVSEITVRARISDGLRSTGHEQRLDGDHLLLTGTCPIFLSTFCDVDYVVEVPRDLGVTATIDDGRLRVVGLTGAIEATSDNGGVEVVDVSGPVHIQSDNGSLRGEGLGGPSVEASSDNGSVNLTFVAPPERVSARSDNGSIVVRLPEVDGAYTVAVESDNGPTEIGVATDPSSSRVIDASSDNGSVRVLPTEGLG